MSLSKNIVTYFGVLIETDELINISSGIALNYEIVEYILDCLEKENELMSQFLLERICQKIIPFQNPIKKNKFKSFP